MAEVIREIRIPYSPGVDGATGYYHICLTPEEFSLYQSGKLDISGLSTVAAASPDCKCTLSLCEVNRG